MQKTFLKTILLLAPILLITHAKAFNFSGLGVTKDSYYGLGTNLSGEWCISKTIDESKINCGFRSNNEFVGETHKVVCTLNVAVAQILESEYNEYARGRDEYVDKNGKPFQIWAYHEKIPGGNLLAGMSNIPLYLLKTQVDGAINLLTENTLSDIKQKFDQIKYGPEMVEAIYSILKQRSCSNIRFSTQFNQKKLIQTQPLSIKSQCVKRVPVNDMSRACFNIESRNTYKEVSYSVDQSGNLVNPVVSPNILVIDEVENKCFEAYYSENAIEKCKEDHDLQSFKLNSKGKHEGEDSSRFQEKDEKSHIAAKRKKPVRP